MNNLPESPGLALSERFGCTVREACQATGLKPTKLYELIAAGAIETTKIGKRRIVLVRSLRRLIEGDDIVSSSVET